MSDDFNWLNDNQPDDGDETPDDSSGDKFDWQRDGEEEKTSSPEERTGVTGLLNWRRGGKKGEQPSADDDDDIPDIEWDTPDGGGKDGLPARTGVTGMLNWLDSHEDSFERQVEEAERAMQALEARQKELEQASAEDVPEPDKVDDLFGAGDDDNEDVQDFAQDVPDWLQGGDETSFEDAPTVEVQGGQKAGLGGLLGMLGDDFSDDDEDFTASDADLQDSPDWLTELEPDAQPEAPIASFEPFDADDDALDYLPDDISDDDSDSLPDWLLGGTDDDAALSSEADDDSEEVPDWLTMPDAPEATESIEPLSAFTDNGDDSEEIPDWLTGLPDDEAEEDDIDAVPDWLSESGQSMETAFDVEDADVDIDALPDWLQGDDVFEEEEAEPDPLLSMFDGGDDSEEFDFASLADAPSPVKGFDDFDEDDFIAETSADDDDDFDLLGGLGSARTGFTGMLSDPTADDDSGDFDLLGELAGDELPAEDSAFSEAEADDFSFFDAVDEDEAQAEPIAQEDPDAVFQRMFGDAQETPIADAVADDDDFLTMAGARGFGDDDSGDEEDPFRDAFFDKPKQASSVAQPDELDWLSGISDDDIFNADDISQQLADERDSAIGGFAPRERSYADVDDYLASLDDDIPLPTTGDVAMSNEVDFDTFFDERLGTETAGEAPPELAPDAPDWLADLSEGAVGAGSAAALARQKPDRPVDALGDQLKNLRERGLNLKVMNVTGDTPAIERIIPGVSNTLPAVVFEPGDVEVLTDVLLTDEQRQRTAILTTLAGAEEESARRQAKKRRRFLSDRLLIGLLLLAVMAAPFLSDSFNIGDRPPAQFLPGTVPMTFYQAIEAVESNDLVLVAADFGSAGGAELDGATDALLRHILARGGRPVIVSGNALGLLRAENLMDGIAAQNTLTRNQDYVIGSYLVGDTIGLRNFAQNIERYVNTDARGNSTGLSINSLDDFRLIVVIVESADRARAWGEQVSPLTNTAISAITAQGAAPLSEPYLQLGAENLAAYIVGYRDGVVYEGMVSTLIASGGRYDFNILPTATPTFTPTITPTPTQTPLPTDTPPPTATPTEIPTDAPTTAPTIEGEAIVPVEVEPTNTPAATNTPRATNTPPPTNTPAPTATATSAVARFAVVNVDSAVNVRVEPSTTVSAVGALRPEERALIIGEQTNASGELWYNIRFFDVNGALIEGWIRSDLVTIETTTGSVERFFPTPTPEGVSVTTFSKRITRAQADDDSDASDEADEEGEALLTQEEVIATLTALPLATATARAERTPGLPVIYDYSLQPLLEGLQFTPTPPGPRALERNIAPPEMADSDARWYSITLGLIFAVVVIAFGSVYNVLRLAGRRNRPKRN